MRINAACGAIAITCTTQRRWCIQEAFEPEAKLDAARILVQLAGDGTVLLTGSARSSAERIEAERTAWPVRFSALLASMIRHRRSTVRAWQELHQQVALLSSARIGGPPLPEICRQGFIRCDGNLLLQIADGARNRGSAVREPRGRCPAASG
jgi:hypothetical protein